MTNTKQSSQKTSSEWEVFVGRNSYILTRDQYEVLEEALKNNERGTLIFNDFAISLAHFSDARKVGKPVSTYKQLPEPDMNDEEVRENLEKLQRMKDEILTGKSKAGS